MSEGHTREEFYSDAMTPQEKILSSLIGATEGDSLKSSTSPPYKFAVNSTIIQNIAQLGSEVDKATLPARRGMHSAAGAFWNNERDGFWSYKFAAGEAKGMDVVVLIFWIGL